MQISPARDYRKILRAVEEQSFFDPYQQTFVDTYVRVAHAKLHSEKTAITAADLFNDRVIPFLAEHGIALLRVLTDRGAEYCGKVKNSDQPVHSTAS